jgi:hypothetical protein
MTYKLSQDPKNSRWLKPALKNPKPEPVYSIQVCKPDPKATHKIIYYHEDGELCKKVVPKGAVR